MRSQKAVFLIGSPKGFQSSSYSLGSYLVKTLKRQGFQTWEATVGNFISAAPEQQDLLSNIDSCGILVLAAPLYVDSLPAPVMRALELISEHRKPSHQSEGPMMVGIVNSGFPESFHNNTALAILRRFATESGFIWAGGLALGGGGAINGNPLKDTGGLGKNVIKSLDITASAVIQGKTIPVEAIELMAKPLYPKWPMPLLGGLMWRWQARKYGAQNRLKERPYEKLQGV